MLRPLRFSTLVAGAAAAIVLGVGGGAIVAANTTDESVAPLVSASVTTVADTVALSTTSTPSSSTSTTAPVVTGAMRVSSTIVNLGASTISSALQIRNSGGIAFDWSVTGNATPFAILNGGGTLQPGQNQTMTVAITRSGLPEGDYERTITIVPGDSGAAPVTVVLRARVEHAPVLTLDGPEGDVFSNCPG